MDARRVFAVLLIAIVGLSGCSSGDEEGTRVDTREVVARVDDWKLTQEQLQTAIDALSPSDKEKYDTPGGRVELTDALIQEELYYREGRKLGMHESPEITEAVEAYERQLVMAKYFREEIRPLAVPEEDELHDYYQDNIERFTRQPIARAAHILSRDNPDKLLEYKRLVESGEEKFTKLAVNFSEDALTSQEGGDLGYFNKGGYMRGVGYVDELSETAFSLKVGEISNPVKWKNGWSIVVLTEMRPPVIQPFEEAREAIVESFWRSRRDQLKQAAYEELSKNYDVINYLDEDLKLTTRTPEELWNLAQNSSDSYERLRYYQEIATKYPDDEHASKALFMVGFVSAEELKDYPTADRAFTRVINEYPDSEVAESARYMLETMRGGTPELDERQDRGSDGG